jgi:SAM-dependent methyltransferase
MNDMENPQPQGENAPKSQEFDSLAYWRGRHEQYRLNPQGVGNAAYDVAKNDLIYEAMDAYVANLVLQLHKSAPVRVLDLGCGTGMLAGAFLRTGCEYTGFDISETAVNLARSKYPAGRFEVGNIADLPISGPFDIVIERTVFIHLVEDAYWKSVIREVARLLATDGVFIVMDQLPLSQAEAPATAAHVKFRLYTEYAEALAKHSLQFDLDLRRRMAGGMALSPHTHFVTRSARP